MIFAQIDNNNNVIAFPLTEESIKLTNFNVSIPHPFEDNLPEGYVKVGYVSQPSISVYQNAVKSTMPILVNGVWKEEWVITEKLEVEKEAIFEQQKLYKISQINSYRNQLEQGGFPYLDKILDSDQVSVQRLTIAAMAAQAAISVSAPFSVNWVCKDNSILVMDAVAMMGAIPTLASYATTLHTKAMTLKLSVHNLVYPNVVALDTFDIVAAWNAN